jgi:hypothetical protein
MYFPASRAENFIHRRLRPVPARKKNISVRPGPARGAGLRATGPPVTARGCSPLLGSTEAFSSIGRYQYQTLELSNTEGFRF